MKRLFCFAVAAAVTPAAWAGPLDGVWEAKTRINGVEVPFRIELSGEGTNFKGAFFDGDVKFRSTSGRLDKDTLVLNFDHFLGKLEAKLKDGKIEGTYANNTRLGTDAYEFQAQRPSQAPPTAVGDVPSIDGVWEVPHESPKGEKSWRFIVRQDGPKARATILRVDGDTGTLTGDYKNGTFELSLFSGSKALRVDATPQKDGTLKLVVYSRYTRYSNKNESDDNRLTAYRPADARAKGLPEPTDPGRHTSVKDADQPFKFRFPDLQGRIVSNEDPRFKNKVVVAVVTGSWCPNCHDEAQYLVELYRKYRDKGLEIVALDFEELEQQEEGLSRVRAFVKQYGVEYTYLIAGAPLEMWVKLPQAENLNSWPTTFFIGRDGRVKSVHAGFASPASGDVNRKLKADFVAKIEKLLDENATASR